MAQATLKKIRRNHLLEIEDLYLKSEPYSDFNVVSLWGYMVPDARFTIHEGSGIFEMIDYNTNERYLSLFGNSDPENLIQKVFGDNSGHLKFYNVPENTLQLLKDSPAFVSAVEDESNHDYVFSVSSIASLDSEDLKHKKKSLNKLLRRFPNLHAEVINHHEPNGRKRMYRLFRRWIEQSHSDDYERELRALKRALKIEGFPIVCIGAFDGRKLVGFTVNEIEKNGYYQGHFGKANYRYPNLGFYLEHETAKYLHSQFNCSLMNLQQDMGIEGIRYYKRSLKPLKQLKKYTVDIDLDKLPN